MNLITEITSEEIGCHFSDNFVSFLIAVNVVADWDRKVGTGSYNQWMESDASKEMAIKFGTFLRAVNSRQHVRAIKFFRDTIEAYENER